MSDIVTADGECGLIRYRFSPIARRGCCRAYGTPLTYDTARRPTVGSVDDPDQFGPVSHPDAEGLHEAWLDTRHLPRERTPDNPRIAQQWIEACGNFPDRLFRKLGRRPPGLA